MVIKSSITLSCIECVYRDFSLFLATILNARFVFMTTFLYRAVLYGQLQIQLFNKKETLLGNDLIGREIYYARITLACLITLRYWPIHDSETIIPIRIRLEICVTVALFIKDNTLA